MKHYLHVTLVTLLGLSLLSPTTVYAAKGESDNQPGKQHHSQQAEGYLIKFKDPAKGEKKLEKKQKRHGKPFKHLSVLTASDLSEDDVTELKNDPNVEYIEPDHSVVSAGDRVTPNMEQVHVPEAQQTGVQGTGVKVAVLDTGIDRDSKELKVADGVSFVSAEPEYDDENGHGTHVAGILAARKDDQGLVGVAPGVDLYAVKVLDRSGAGTYSQLIEGVEWAIDHEMDIVSMSLAGREYSKALEEIMQKAAEKGILLVAATGNDGVDDSVSYPAKFSSVLAVGAVDENNQKAPFSNSGPEVKLMAPGVKVESLWIGDEYAALSGTSMAVPHATGAAALLKEQNPRWKGHDLSQRLLESAKEGILDAAGALSVEHPSEEDTPVPEVEPQPPADGTLPPADESDTLVGSAADTYEPNDLKSQAVAVSPKTVHSSYIYSEYDDDYYKFTAQNTGRIGLISTGTSFPYSADVTKADGSLVLRHSVGQKSVFNVVAGDTYYLQFYGNWDLSSGGNCGIYCPRIAVSQSLEEVTDPDSQAVQDAVIGERTRYYSTTQAYTFQLTDIVDPDQYEPNESISTAYEVAPNGSYHSSLSFRVDQDYYKFVPTLSGYIDLGLTVPVDVNLDLKLYQSSGNEIASSTNAAGRPERMFTAVQAGQTYYVQVVNKDQIDGLLAYTLQLSPVLLDNLELNDDTATAYMVVDNTLYNAYLSQSTDVDYYKFIPQIGGTYHITMKVPTDQNYDLIIYDAGMNQIAAGTSGMGISEEVAFRASANATYYMKVVGVDGDFGTAPYHFKLTRVIYQYVYDGSNRLLEIHSTKGMHLEKVVFNYDANGNLLQRRNVVTEETI